MAGSPWIDGLFGVLSVLVALYAASRLVLALRAGDRAGVPGELTHLLMAAGMAAMFLSVNPLPSVVWIVVYAVNGAWLIASLPRGAAGGVFAPGQRHHLHQVIAAAAMAYMFIAMGTPAPAEPSVASVALPASGAVVLAHDHGGGGGGGAGFSLLTVAFALYFLAHALWSAGPLVRPVPQPAGQGSVAAVPRLLAGVSDIVMGLGMSYMFATMLR